MRVFWKTAAVAGACAACCAAPMAIVPIAAAFGIATAGLAFVNEIGTAIALIALAISVYVWQRRKAARSCQCAPDAGCKTGASCDLPSPAGTGNSG